MVATRNDDFNNVVIVDDIVLGLDLVGTETHVASEVCLFPFGHSIISADMISRCADRLSDIPVWISDDGRIPGWIEDGSDAVVISYDGSEAAEDCCEILISRGCHVHVITSSIDLAENSDGMGCDVILLPGDRSAFDAFGFEIGAIAGLLDCIGIGVLREEIESSIPSLRLAAETICSNLDCLDFVESIRGHTVSVYSTAENCAVARRWKDVIELARGCPAFFGELPEFDHNEIVGWSDRGVQSRGMSVVVLTGTFVSDMQGYIVGSMIEVLRENGRTVMEVPLMGENLMERNLYGIMLGNCLLLSLRRCDA